MKNSDPLNLLLMHPKLKAQESLTDALIETADTLRLCWAASRSVFGSKAKPEHALTLLPTVMTLTTLKRQQLQAQAIAQMGDEMSPAAANRKKRPGGSAG